MNKIYTDNIFTSSKFQLDPIIRHSISLINNVNKRGEKCAFSAFSFKRLKKSASGKSSSFLILEPIFPKICKRISFIRSIF